MDRTPRAYTPDREWFVVESKGGSDSPVEADYFTFIVFEPGQFQMGSPENEGGRYDGETFHPVRLTRAFAICDREVTVAQYARFQASQSGPTEPVSERLDHPVVEVSWFDTVEYCRWLTSRRKGYEDSDQCYVSDTGDAGDDSAAEQTSSWKFDPTRPGFRLPTEAEWEYACRAGTVTRFSFGSDDDRLGRYARFSQDFEDTISTSSGGLLRPNPRGLFDMHGNVWEWVHDWYAEYPASAVDPTGPAERSGQLNGRVLRGGSWAYEAAFCRSAVRYVGLPHGVYPDNGFRVCVCVSAARTGP